MSRTLNITAEDVDDLRHMLGVSERSPRTERHLGARGRFYRE